MIRLRLLIFPMLFLVLNTVTAQKTLIHEEEYAPYREALDLYDKEMFNAAQKKFEALIEAIPDSNDELVVHAYYYRAVCAMELYHPDAEFMFKEFAKRYPESTHIQSVYFKLGSLYYRHKRWRQAIEWFESVDRFQLTKDDLAAFYFKKGYAHFQEEEYKEAAASFREIKDVESQFQSPAIYYYSHIAYQDGNYQTALEGFKLLVDKPGFDRVVPYYITQIYYLQGKYEEVIDYGAPLLDTVKPERLADVANLIGDSYYKLEKYDESVPFLEIHYQESKNTTLEEKYRLGYAYYKSGQFDKASVKLAKVSRVKNELGQIALYHLGDCYVKMDEKSYARNAYQEAASLEYDPQITEDALWRYAQLAYELSYNPYDEAIEAFQKYIADYPDNPRADDAYQYLINVYLTTKNYKAALESLEKVEKTDIRLQSAYQMVVFNRGVELYVNERFDEAIEHFKKVKKYPLDKKLNSQSYFWIGESYYSKERFDEARYWYDKYIKEPGSFSSDLYGVAHYNIAYTWLKDEKYQKAIEEFRQYENRHDGDEVRLNDAYLRIADSYFAKEVHDDEMAVQYYEKAIKLNLSQQDYALFQQGMSYGYLQKYDEKIASMNKIINYYGTGNFVAPAKFQIGEAYRVQGETKQAIKYYEQVVEQFPGNLLVRESLVSLGQLYLLDKQFDKSISTYIRILQEYNSPEDCRAAILGLKDVYAATDELEKWQQTAQEYDCFDLETLNLDSTYFAESIQTHWVTGECEKIIKNADKYLDLYPNALHKHDALFYKAECLFHNERKDEAVVYYERLLKLPSNEHTELSLVRASLINYNQQRYQEAFAQYSNLEKLATSEENKKIADIGQMRCLYYMKDYTNARHYASRVILYDNITEFQKVQANLILGMSYMHLQDYDKAITQLKLTNKMTKSVMGAEAKFHVAYIYFVKEEHKEVENQILELIKQKPSYDYWVARGYILLADNFVAQGNNFQAKHTLQSVIDNYVGDDDILPTAREKLAQIIESEKEENDSEGETRSMEINIGDEDADEVKGKSPLNEEEKVEPPKEENDEE